MAKVSAIIPLYNQEKYIGAAIDSALTQTYADLEVIVVDDASQDRGHEIACEYQRRYRSKVKILRNRKNRGVSFSRNKGVKKARGCFLAFLDADDIWFPTKIQKQLACFENAPQTGLVHTGVVTMADKGARQWLASGKDKCVLSIEHWDRAFNGFCHKASRFIAEDYFISLLESNGICTSSVMVRREVFHTAGGFAEELPFQVEDWLQWLKIAMFFRIVPLAEPLTGYRFHPQSHTARHFIKADFTFSNLRTQISEQCRCYYPKRFSELLRAREGT